MKWIAFLVAVAVGAQLEDARLTKAKAMLDALNKGDWEAACKHLDKTMKEKQTPEKSKELWEAVTKQLGAFKKVERVETSKVGSSNIVDLICQFDKMLIKVRVSFNKDDEVQGFFLLPATAAKFDPPPYAKPDTFREEKVTVGEGGDWPLPGTLTLPKGKGPFPVAILVQGSGPHDRDETIGPNKPFRDLAWGLATQGIAVLRYEKRTYVHGARMIGTGKVTLDEEVTDDALAAARAVRKNPEIDPKRIFVVGHSLGAFAAPRIAEKDAGIAGIVLLAGNSRPLEDLVLEQFTYIYSLEGELSEKRKEELADIKKKVMRVKDPKLAADAPAKELALGLPASYWKSLNAYDQTATAAKLAVPMLVLQGERDYQVTMEDLAGWKKALTRKGVKLKSYADLNHLFMTGKGKAKPAEYGKAGHVAKEVIDDIAGWVKAR